MLNYKMKKYYLGVVALITTGALLLGGCNGNGAQQSAPGAEPQVVPSSQPPSPEQNVEADNSNEAGYLSINKEDLADSLEDYLIVDLRQDEYYLGFADEGISRGGHLPGAKQFTYEWLNFLDDAGISLPDLLTEKGIVKNERIVIYHSDNDVTNDFAVMLNELGYDNVFIFEDLTGWTGDASLPMDSAPAYEIFVNAGWVNQLISNQKPPTFENDNYIILEASWGPVSEVYNEGHIPGSYHFDTDNFETEENFWNIGPVDRVKDSLRAFGIMSDTTVVVYSDDPSAAGRVTLALLWAGVEDVRYLNGGWEAWRSSGFEIETTANEPIAGNEFDVNVPQHPEYLIAMPTDVLEAQKDENFRLVSIRSWEEFIGATSGYSYIEGAGEPEGAVWGHAGSDPYHMEDYIDVDGTLRNFAEIQELWAEWDIKKSNSVSFYCGTGWRATIPWLMAYSYGWENISMFDGGWYTWEMDKTLPVQLGDPRNKQ